MIPSRPAQLWTSYIVACRFHQLAVSAHHSVQGLGEFWDGKGKR